MEFCSPTEADLLKDLKHPGIPLIYDIDEDDTTLYIVEEYIPGESLDRMMVHPENISQELILKIGFELCDILDYLHHTAPYPILYQDLKPEHIIVCGNQVKLIDFGIASFLPVPEKFPNLRNKGICVTGGTCRYAGRYLC